MHHLSNTRPLLSREFVGREHELQELAQALHLAGEIGLGKTRRCRTCAFLLRLLPELAAQFPGTTPLAFDAGQRVTSMRHFPTGTITLLFTDIEASTQLLQQPGERYPSVLAECRRLLHHAFHTYRGHEVNTQGDAFFVVFARATSAVSAAVAGQRALARHAWPEGVTVRVRMGLHTGEPELTPEGYTGQDVHHASRIMSAAHGGQILLSPTTRELVEHALPAEVSLRDLGVHRLKDLQLPIRLFQVVIADLPTDYPLLKTLDARLHNLPVQPTPLIGREREVATIGHLLQQEEIRLVTLTGSGGVGKTRLGLQVAAELAEHFSDGVFFVNLAPVSDPTLVVPSIAQRLGIREVADQPLLERLKEQLQQRQLLLLLDNFEQVMSAAVQVTDLLAACQGLKVLVTSRAVLHVRAEHVFTVPPLALPDPAHLPDLAPLPHFAAVVLFLERAQAVKPDFQLTAANARAIADICVCLDGLPLALELAAARIKLLPPQVLLKRLSCRLTVLTGGSRDVPVRQQTLRNNIAWSYHLLDAAEQRLFQRLSAFVGGCTLEAAEAVCTTMSDGPAGEALSVLDGVASLIDKSLLQQVEQGSKEPRLMMLETIREYGLECLVSSREAEVTHRAHAAYYLALAEQAEPGLTGAGDGRWLERLQREHENLRAALAWLAERNEWEKVLRLGSALWRFWWMGGYYSEGRAELARALAAGERGVATSTSAKALHAAGALANAQADFEQAEALCRESLALFKVLGDLRGIATSLTSLGEAAWQRSDYAAARSLLDESLALFKALGDRQNVAQSLFGLSWISFVQGDYATAHALLEESLALFKAVGNKWFIAICLVGCGALATAQGDWTWAARLAGAAEVLCQAINGILPPAWRAVQEATIAAAHTQLEEEAFTAAWAEGRTMTPEQALAAQGPVMMAMTAPAGPSSVPHTRKSPIHPAGLTAREVEVLRLVAQGMTNVQMAKHLAISPRTVNTHLTLIFGKVGVSTRSAATRYALDHHLV